MPRTEPQPRRGGVQPLPPGTVIPLESGNIILGDTLGTGGFGATYIAYDEELRSIVCVKEFLPAKMLAERRDANNRVVVAGGFEEVYEHAFRGFYREARILNRLRVHPNIVKVFSYITANNTAYYTMELLKGKSLRQWIRERGAPLSAAESCQLLYPIMQALSFTHSKKVLHRDISPNNIFLCDVPGKPNVFLPKLIDFGAAYAGIQNFTHTYQLIQTKGFTPYEQVCCGEEDQGEWVDVYAFCATVYYCITLRPPPPSTDVVIKGMQIPLPSDLGANISPQAEMVLMEGLNSWYKSRIPTIHDFQTRFMTACGLKVPSQKNGAASNAEVEDSFQSSSRRIETSPYPTAPSANPPQAKQGSSGSHDSGHSHFYLYFSSGPNKGAYWRCSTAHSAITIGRSSQSANVVLEDPRVSKKHCRIEEPQPNYFVLSDCGSTNGTLLNGKRVAPKDWVQLSEGDTIILGENVLVFTLTEPGTRGSR